MDAPMCLESRSVNVRKRSPAILEGAKRKLRRVRQHEGTVHARLPRG